MPQYTYAQEIQKISSIEKIKIGDAYYTRGQIIADFLDVAFSSKMWNEDSDKFVDGNYIELINRFINFRKTHAQSQLDEVRKSIPWIYQYFDGNNKLPRHDSINKWDGPVGVVLGWPGVLPDESFRDDYAIVEKQLDTVLPYFNQQLEGSNIFRAGAQISSKNIHIIIDEMSFYKRTPATVMTSLNFNPALYEWMAFGGVLYESSDYNFMDGYFLPNSKNRIQIASCKIRNGLGSSEVQRLVNECVSRSLGMPGILESRESIFGESQKKTAISSYDTYLMRILYCSAIKAGMDKIQVLEVLTKDTNCFKI